MHLIRLRLDIPFHRNCPQQCTECLCNVQTYTVAILYNRVYYNSVSLIACQTTAVYSLDLRLGKYLRSIYLKWSLQLARYGLTIVRWLCNNTSVPAVMRPSEVPVTFQMRSTTLTPSLEISWCQDILVITDPDFLKSRCVLSVKKFHTVNDFFKFNNAVRNIFWNTPLLSITIQIRWKLSLLSSKVIVTSISPMTGSICCGGMCKCMVRTGVHVSTKWNFQEKCECKWKLIMKCSLKI